ncbi:MAG TPA: PIN domain-containing protein, partial [Beijerinckiaceae bacterium]|nr:PIN domain-containing protein [Beijerinckiaceae bacterium]
MQAVLDSSAVLAFLRAEPGHETVAGIMPGSLLSAVNFAEVVTKLVERGGSAARAVELAATLPYRVVDFDEDLAARAGVLWT